MIEIYPQSILTLNNSSYYQFVKSSDEKEFERLVIKYYVATANDSQIMPIVCNEIFRDLDISDLLYEFLKELYYTNELSETEDFPQRHLWTPQHDVLAEEYFNDNEGVLTGEFLEDIHVALNKYQMTFVTEDFHDEITVHNNPIIEVW
jgi:hypothetical protein